MTKMRKFLWIFTGMIVGQVVAPVLLCILGLIYGYGLRATYAVTIWINLNLSPILSEVLS